MRFDWDTGKAVTNRRKHGVSFEEAREVFSGAAFLDDLSHSETEPRFLAIGLSSKNRWLTVAFARPEPDLCRIINARKATKLEQAYYAQAKREEKQEPFGA